MPNPVKCYLYKNVDQRFVGARTLICMSGRALQPSAAGRSISRRVSARLWRGGQLHLLRREPLCERGLKQVRVRGTTDQNHVIKPELHLITQTGQNPITNPKVLYAKGFRPQAVGLLLALIAVHITQRRHTLASAVLQIVRFSDSARLNKRSMPTPGAPLVGASRVGNGVDLSPNALRRTKGMRARARRVERLGYSLFRSL